MNREELKNLLNLLDRYRPPCNENCDKCAFGVRNIYEDDTFISCPIDQALDVVFTELYDPNKKDIFG